MEATWYSVSLNLAYYITCLLLLTVFACLQRWLQRESRDVLWWKNCSNLNHKHCYWTVQSRPALVYLFHALRWCECMCLCVCVFAKHNEEMTRPHPTPLHTHPLERQGSLITLKGRNGHHNEADRGAISKPSPPHCRVQKQQLRPWCYLCHYEIDVTPVIQHSWIMLIRALTNTKRGLPHIRLPPSPHYLTRILYRINTRLVQGRKGAMLCPKIRSVKHWTPY